MHDKYNIDHKLKTFAQNPPDHVFSSLGSSADGLDERHAESNRQLYGTNDIVEDKADSVYRRMKKSFINPFSVVLFILAAISLFTDILQPEDYNSDYTNVIIIVIMLLVSGCVRFISEMRAKKIADDLTDLVESPVKVLRNGIWIDMTASYIVTGDVVRLRAGDRVPADIRIISAYECYVSQSEVTGESSIIHKDAELLKEEPSGINDYRNILFAGTSVTGGLCEGIVVNVGEHTVFGKTSLSEKQSSDGFERGANSIAWVLIRFMAVLIPFVFIAGGITKDNWVSALIFALSVAVGLTPELLPMVINACLAKGSSCMGKKNTVVKNINSMQAFGSIDVLCTDKTGTLTSDILTLEYYTDILGREDEEVLKMAVLNSYHHTGIANPLDKAVLNVMDLTEYGNRLRQAAEASVKLDELPFDYNRKTASVLIRGKENNQIIMKGDPFSIIKRCRYVSYRNSLQQIDEGASDSVHAVIDEMTECGMKVLAVAAKQTEEESIAAAGEEDMVLQGYIAFFDAPKDSARSAVIKLEELNVAAKILTGDSREVAVSVGRRVGLDADYVVTGNEFASMNEDQQMAAVEDGRIFAELSPQDKADVIKMLRMNGHSVGFLGDGMNDLPAMISADVGICVDTAVEAVKEASDVILLKKDLNVLEEGIIEGRRAFTNMSKYIRITASSNFGNILAIVVASVMLPFFPMTSVQLLLLNLLYDILCLILPWDNVDREFFRKPYEWSGKDLSRFMLHFGPVSSVFDIITYLFLYFYICPYACGGDFSGLSQGGQELFVSVFQTGWFLESMWTQILILHLLRTSKLPFIQSSASGPVIIVTIAGIVLFTLLAVTPVGGFLGMTALPARYFIFLLAVVTAYLSVITIVKKVYLKRYRNLI